MPVITENDNKLFDSEFPLRVGGEKGEEFGASMLCDKDWGDLDQWIRSVYIKMAYDAADMVAQSQLEESGIEQSNGKQLNEEQRRIIFAASQKRKELIEIALNAATDVGWNSVAGNNIITRDEGFIRLGWQMSRKRNPNLAYKQFNEIARRDIDSTIIEVDKVYKYFHGKKDNGQKQGESGGSSVVSNKS